MQLTGLPQRPRYFPPRLSRRGTTWGITEAENALLGGYVIQEIPISWTVKDCSGKVKVAKSAGQLKSPLKYWEGWPVIQIGKNTTFPDANADIFSWLDEGNTTGEVSWEGKAYFSINTRELVPEHGWVGWEKRNKETMAGHLYSSIVPVKMPSSAMVTHGLKIAWDCCSISCAGAARKTKIISQTPPSSTP
ncbi:MAG: hypothetical protein AB7J34_15805 [Limisphaerales bacterium]